MPSSWSSRLLPNAAASSTTPTRGPSNTNKPLPRTPNEYLDPPPTLHHERSPASPSQLNPQPRREHTRSSSNPLPKLFGRKKSSGNLRYHDSDGPFDDDLLSAPADRAESRPVQVIAGKKSKADNDATTTTRNCMCCDSKVKVPQALNRFRCTCCLTVNDLKPVEQQLADERLKQQARRADTDPKPRHPGIRMPISVDRTRATIDRCLLAYLEARSKSRDGLLDESKVVPSKDNPIDAEPRALSIPIRYRQNHNDGGQISDAPMASSPPDTPDASRDDIHTLVTKGDPAETQHSPGTRTKSSPLEQNRPSPGPGPPRQLPRKPLPSQPTRKPPPPPMNLGNGGSSQRLTPSLSAVPRAPSSAKPSVEELEQRRRYDRVKAIFRPLEDYLQSNYGNYQCLNSSFSTVRPVIVGRARSESNIRTPPPEPASDDRFSPGIELSELDAKTLLLGDIGENGSWWTGKFDRSRSGKALKRKKVGEGSQKAVSSKSPNINWAQLMQWYDLIHHAGLDWRMSLERETAFVKPEVETHDIPGIEADLAEARDHVVRVLLKNTENLLKQPSRPIKEPEDLRFILIILSNPSLYPAKRNRSRSNGNGSLHRSGSSIQRHDLTAASHNSSPQKTSGREGNKHTGLLKRIFGLLANAPETCHRYLVGWFARLDEEAFVKMVDLVATFVTYRISRRSARPRSRSAVIDNGLIPDLSGSAMNTSAQLHSAMGLSGSVKNRMDKTDAEPDWTDDWQIRAAAKVMSLLFAANNIWQGKRRDAGGWLADSLTSDLGNTPSAKARRSGQLLHTSSFYNMLLDYHDLIADFKIWETKREKFAFCQYPLFISMGGKIKILEYDARRQMEIKAREAYFDQVIERRAIDGHFHLRVRRECMVEDSFQQISAAVGAGQEELKKGVRVHFAGEEGVDAGGLRKEWFLLLVRDIFSPDHGMFVYDDESHTCYFNPNSFETSDQYYLVGALLGLAIYNSTILDVALPPFAFRKLLAAAPLAAAGTTAANVTSLTGTKGQMTYTVSDLAELRPSLAAGLQQLLDFDGDVEVTYCRDFVAPVEVYGMVKNVPLIPNGEGTPVTNHNRQEFVDAYVRYLLDTAVARQFEPFKRGFFTVCAGNALSLFRAEEIELLIRGSDEVLDVDSLRAVAVYENWKDVQPPHLAMTASAAGIPVVAWFWELFAEASPQRQRQLLTFVTGSDRIPAVGATSLILRIVAGGDGWGGGGPAERARFPVARTCFNMLVLWRYDSREQLEEKLWRAVEESEGFGLK